MRFRPLNVLEAWVAVAAGLNTGAVRPHRVPQRTEPSMRAAIGARTPCCRLGGTDGGRSCTGSRIGLSALRSPSTEDDSDLPASSRAGGGHGQPVSNHVDPSPGAAWLYRKKDMVGLSFLPHLPVPRGSTPLTPSHVLWPPVGVTGAASRGRRRAVRGRDETIRLVTAQEDRGDEARRDCESISMRPNRADL